jgi:hypothetical protein
MPLRRFLPWFLLALALPVRAAVAPPPELPVETFFKKSNIAQLTFSPDGKRIACLVPYERRMNLAVIDLEKKTKNLLTNFKDNDVGSLLWALFSPATPTARNGRPFTRSIATAPTA